MKTRTSFFHAWYTASATQRDCSAIGAVSGCVSGGRVSHANSVIQSSGMRFGRMWPAFAAATSSRRSLGRSPSETSSFSLAWCVGPPDVQGWMETASISTVVLHVARGVLPADMHSMRRMNCSGAMPRRPYGVRKLNADSEPATTTLPPCTPWTARANELTRSR